jgi:hypothetical protein
MKCIAPVFAAFSLMCFRIHFLLITPAASSCSASCQARHLRARQEQGARQIIQNFSLVTIVPSGGRCARRQLPALHTIAIDIVVVSGESGSGIIQHLGKPFDEPG